MPRLSTDELDGWLREFRETESHLPTTAHTVDLSWDQTTIDTALVVARLETSGTEAYLQRSIGGSAEWWVTFEAREHEAHVAAADVERLAAEVSAVARLCAFLTERTRAHLAQVAGV